MLTPDAKLKLSSKLYDLEWSIQEDMKKLNLNTTALSAAAIKGDFKRTEEIRIIILDIYGGILDNICAQAKIVRELHQIS